MYPYLTVPSSSYHQSWSFEPEYTRLDYNTPRIYQEYWHDYDSCHGIHYDACHRSWNNEKRSDGGSTSIAITANYWIMSSFIISPSRHISGPSVRSATEFSCWPIAMGPVSMTGSACDGFAPLTFLTRGCSFHLLGWNCTCLVLASGLSLGGYRLWSILGYRMNSWILSAFIPRPHILPITFSSLTL